MWNCGIINALVTFKDLNDIDQEEEREGGIPCNNHE
jgi:hypothetical protein